MGIFHRHDAAGFGDEREQRCDRRGRTLVDVAGITFLDRLPGRLLGAAEATLQGRHRGRQSLGAVAMLFHLPDVRCFLDREESQLAIQLTDSPILIAGVSVVARLPWLDGGSPGACTAGARPVTVRLPDPGAPTAGGLPHEEGQQ